MRFSWIAIAELDFHAYESLRESDYLDVTPNPGFLKPIGIIPHRAYRPWTIRPRIEIWQEVQRCVNKDLGGGAQGSSASLTLRDPGSTEGRIYTFSLRLYRPNLLAIEVHLKSDVSYSLEETFTHRQLSTHKAAFAVVDSLIGIVKSGLLQGYPLNNSVIHRPIMFMPVNLDTSGFESWRGTNAQLIANLLINNGTYDLANPALTEIVFKKNLDADIKFHAGAFSLVSKQGIITAFAETHPVVASHMPDEHVKRVRFLELALVLREFLNRLPIYRHRNENLADFLLFLAQPVLKKDATLSRSVNGTYIWNILSKELALESSIEELNAKTLAEIERKYDRFAKIDPKLYDSLDFMDHVKKSLKFFYFEQFYDKNKLMFAIIPIMIALASAIIAALKLFTPSSS